MFTKAEFALSAASPEQFPELLNEHGLELPEIAIVGRSNVGKSSLLNHLTSNKKLARVSSTPGKTQLLNFFIFNEELCLVDLPGYGFAKVSKKKRLDWGDLIQKYLHERKSLKLILLLIDSRHPPTRDDIAFAKWALHFNKPLLVVFTKVDKLSKSGASRQIRQNFTLLLDEIDDKPVAQTFYSIKDAKTREILIKKIQEALQWD